MRIDRLLIRVVSIGAMSLAACAPAEPGSASQSPPISGSADASSSLWREVAGDVPFDQLPTSVRDVVTKRLARIGEIYEGATPEIGGKVRPLVGPAGDAVEYYEVPLARAGRFAGVIVASATSSDYPIVAWNMEGRSESMSLLDRAAASGLLPRVIRRMGPVGYALETTNGEPLLSEGLATVIANNNPSRTPAFAELVSDALRWRAQIAGDAAQSWASEEQQGGQIRPLSASGDDSRPSACRLATRTPRYNQPVRGDVSAGCGPTAWAIVLGWGSRAAHEGTATSAYAWAWQPGGALALAPEWMSINDPADPAAVVTYKLRDQMNVAELVGQTAAHPNEMGKIYDYVHGISKGGVSTATVFNWFFSTDSAYVGTVRNAICNEQRPVVVGIGSGSTLHYPVAEAFDPATGDYYLNMGWGGGGDGWQHASVWFVGGTHAGVANPSVDDASVFDPSFYLATYSDLRAAFGNDLNAARNHWLKQGLPVEGRRGSPAFDVRFYLSRYADLQATFGTDWVAATKHFLTQGLPFEGRQGSREFDARFYLDNYADLRSAFSVSYASALHHWLTQGLPNEGRRGSRVFDVQYYLANYADLRTTFGTDYRAALNHWVVLGLPTEGRAGAREFNVSYYLSYYADVKNVFGSNYLNAADHFINYGLPLDGRRGSSHFDVRYYLSAYSELQGIFGTHYEAAFDHWVTKGMAEGRRGVPIVLRPVSTKL